MTPEEMRIAIAETCGWEIAHKVGKPGSMMCGCTNHNPMPRQIPDYLNDLNAMHEAEETLQGIELAAYCERLLGGRHHTGWSDNWPAIHATAAQRAEAFCRTMFPERFKTESFNPLSNEQV